MVQLSSYTRPSSWVHVLPPSCATLSRSFFLESVASPSVFVSTTVPCPPCSSKRHVLFPILLGLSPRRTSSPPLLNLVFRPHGIYAYLRRMQIPCDAGGALGCCTWSSESFVGHLVAGYFALREDEQGHKDAVISAHTCLIYGDVGANFEL